MDHKTNQRASFNLPYPPSANRLWTIAKSFQTRRALLIQTPEYVAWLSLVKASTRYGNDLPKLGAGRFSVEIVFFPPKEGVADVDNRIKPTLDALTKLGVWEDDKYVERVLAVRGKPAKKPFIHISISSLTGESPEPEQFGGDSKIYKSRRPRTRKADK